MDIGEKLRLMRLQKGLTQEELADRCELSKGFISLLDTPDVIAKKFKSAVTDSEACVRYAEGKDGVNNLMSIYSCCTGRSYEQIEKEFEGKGYGDFKSAVADAVIAELAPVQSEFTRLINERAYLEECMRKGAEAATRISQRTLDKAMKKIGFYQFKS